MDSEADDYEPTDSEQEYDEEERELLQDLRKEQKKRAKKLQNKKQEVLLFSDSDNEQDDDVAELMRDSDIEGAEDDDDGLPDTMNWGGDKRNYYNTDFVDPDYSSYNAQEEDMANAEEEEAKKIQLRLAKQLTEADFMLDDMDQPTEASKADRPGTIKAAESIKVTTRLGGLNKRERLQLLQKVSPEFMGLIQDFQKDISELQELMTPVLNYVRNHEVPIMPALQFASHYQNLLLTYSTNVSFYLLLKARRVNIKLHPVVKRLLQLQRLREELEPRYETYIRPQLEALLERIQNGDSITVLDVAQRKAKLQILNKYNECNKKADDDNDDDNHEDNIADIDDEEQNLEDRADETDEDHARRGITYQMAKNKGLTPHRKKELRNPRVKHRGKYRKALIRRKGAVRTVRKETQRYGGESSGIKATVTKSVKFKT